MHAATWHTLASLVSGRLQCPRNSCCNFSCRWKWLSDWIFQSCRRRRAAQGRYHLAYSWKIDDLMEIRWFNTQTNIPMLIRASYQNFRNSCFESSLSTDSASDMGRVCMTLHHSSRHLFLHIRPALTIFRFLTGKRLRIRYQLLILHGSKNNFHGITLLTTWQWISTFWGWFRSSNAVFESFVSIMAWSKSIVFLMMAAYCVIWIPKI